jgi:hypothetical protein
MKGRGTEQGNVISLFLFIETGKVRQKLVPFRKTAPGKFLILLIGI